MSAYGLLVLLNLFGKRDQMLDLPKVCHPDIKMKLPPPAYQVWPELHSAVYSQ